MSLPKHEVATVGIFKPFWYSFTGIYHIFSIVLLPFTTDFQWFYWDSLCFCLVLPWFGHGFAMVLMGCYSGSAMLLPLFFWDLPWFCHGFTIVLPLFDNDLPWFCYSFVMVLPWFYHDLPWFCYGFTKIYHGFTMVLSWFCYGFSGICHGFVTVVWNLLMFCHLPHREPFQMKVAIVFVSKLGLPRRDLFQVWGSNIRCCQNWACPAVSPSKYEVAILLVPKLGLPYMNPLPGMKCP